MTPDAPKRRIRRGLIRWALLSLLVLILAALPLINLALLTPFACDRLEAKVGQRLSCQTSIGRISIWPWSGITIHDLEIQLPAYSKVQTSEPLFSVSAIQIEPSWTTLLSRQRHIESITLDTPTGRLPVELIEEILSKTPPPAIPPIAANTTPVPPIPAPASPTSPPSTPVTPPSTPANPPEPATPQPPSKPTPPVVPPVKKPEPLPTTWLHIKNGSLQCDSNEARISHLQISGINGSIPIAGKAAASTLTMDAASLNGARFLTDSEIRLHWSAPRLTLQPLHTRLGELTYQTMAEVQLRRGLPLKIQAALPKQPLQPTDLPYHSKVSAESVEAKAYFLGYLLSPHTWQGDMVAETESPVIITKEEDTHFDRGHALLTLRGGQLSCTDIELTSDKASVLGNATLLSDGRLAANLRLVTQPDIAQHVIHEFFPDQKAPIPLTPLSTPQRVAFDLEARGNLHHVFLTLGRNGPVVEITR